MKKTIPLNLLENGLDFLNEALLSLVADNEKIKLKYTILHICAGVELILKQILFDQRWQWIFHDPNKANENNLKTGNFQSVNYNDLLKRLQEVGIEIPGPVKAHICELRKKRNIIEHYSLLPEMLDGLRGNISIVLMDVIDLIKTHIEDNKLTPIARRLHGKVKRNASRFEEYSQKIIERYKKVLDAEVDRGALIMQCPNCFQPTLVSHVEEKVKCLFCSYTADAEETADDYLEKIEGINAYEVITDGGEYPLFTCPSCETTCLIRKNDGSYFCFKCHAEWEAEELRNCICCGCLYENSTEDLGLCPKCFEQGISKDD